MTTEEKKESTKGWKRVGSNSYIVSKIVINLVLILLGGFTIIVFLQSMQTQASMIKQQENNDLALSEVVSILDKNVEYSDILTDIYHEGNWKLLDDIKLLFDKGLFEKMSRTDNSIRTDIFTEISSQASIPYLYLLSMDGSIVVSTDESLYGRNPASTAHMTQENLNDILAWCTDRDGTVSPVLVRNQFGTYYFYSKPYTFKGRQYALVVGVSSWALDVNISSLKDVSAVLSRMGVINDGFLFAISRKDNLFLYYNNGQDLLTGQNALDAGLTEQIMNDGYKGAQTILGERYYCTSKSFGSDVVLVAAAKANNIVSHDKYVILWSVMGFNLVMILCLVYAIIVRNDFLRHGISTDSVVLFKKSSNPYYFNKQIFYKVFPLVLIGIIAVFGISFYTQTLLEISEGIDKSNVILQEVTGRYEESLASREVIEEYYDSRFLSTARIMSFIVEESPEILNEESGYYHATYDENGNRQYIVDDEGHQLKSVANSALLQKLCDENHISAIYIFDEDGRTIATSTPNWFFVLSNNEGDQSYPFREVLEGRKDSYLQTSMTNDLGEDTQYFGVAMHYYTKTDAAGNTVYVSRYAYEEACAAAGVTGAITVGGITRHSSLLQIEMNMELSNSLLSTTDAASILSTEMLAGGSIVVFDNSHDHVCIYSPVEASIGKTASEMGVSPKAFSGNVYYGFNRINGVNYFQLFRFTNNIFIATAIPKTSMFTSRTIISLITAGVCLFLITILLLTVTVTSRDEEKLYEEMIRNATDDDLNSPMFNIILPSGRSASTVGAMVRWENRRIPWNDLSPEMKLAMIMGWIMAIPTLYFVFSALGINKVSGDDSVIRFILSGGWDRAPNIFALSACIMVMAMVVIALELFRIPVRLCTSLLGTRGETIGHLLLSVVKYGGTIGSLFYCLYLFGIDSANLLASAGILSLVIGLGAQSLIKDIIAGIFIVFEGEFRVGDIVTINGFRGTVTDIGLRTTKIMGEGNVKIFNNSDISGVLNMTKETSVAVATIGVDYGQDFDNVEAVLERELPQLKENNRAILDGPTNLGISELAERRYTVTVIARCSEKDVQEVSRYLNRELLQIFHRNGIIMPNQSGRPAATGGNKA